MDVRSYEAGQAKNFKNKRDNESGGNHKESPRKEVEVVWASCEKRVPEHYVERRAMEMKVHERLKRGIT